MVKFPYCQFPVDLDPESDSDSVSKEDSVAKVIENENLKYMRRLDSPDYVPTLLAAKAEPSVKENAEGQHPRHFARNTCRLRGFMTTVNRNNHDITTHLEASEVELFMLFILRRGEYDNDVTVFPPTKWFYVQMAYDCYHKAICLSREGATEFPLNYAIAQLRYQLDLLRVVVDDYPDILSKKMIVFFTRLCQQRIHMVP